MWIIHYFGVFLLVLLPNTGQVFGQLGFNEGAWTASGGGFPSIRNITTYYRQLGSRFNDVSMFNGTGIKNFFSEIINSPGLKIALRVNELLQSNIEPTDIIIDVVSSSDTEKLISIWLTRLGVPEEQISDVQIVVASKEMISLIKTLDENNNSSSTNTVCAIHYFTKLPEFRKLLTFVTNELAPYKDQIMQQLNTVLTAITGTPTTMDGISELLNLDGLNFTRLVFSPITQAFLDVFCELVSRDDIPTIGIDTQEPGTPSDSVTNNGTDTNNITPKASAQVLSQVADLTNASPDEVINQLQAILGSPGLVETIGNFSNSFDINGFVDQIGLAITAANITALQGIFAQLLNASQENGTSALEELISGFVDQASESVQLILPFVQQYLENVLRSTLKENGVSETCQDSSMVFISALIGGETWALQFIDAMGKVPSNLLGLPLKWLGSFEECTNIRGPAGQGIEQIKGKYCRTAIRIPELAAVGAESITVGTCIPDSCSASDTIGMLLTVQKLLLNGSTPLVPDITCVEELEFGRDAVIVTCILVVFGFVVFFGTLYDVVTVQMRSGQASEKNSSSESKETLSSSTSSSIESTSRSDLPASLYTPIKTRTSPGYINDAFTSAEKDMTSSPDAFSNEKNVVSTDGEVKFSDVSVNIPKEDKPVSQADDSNKGALEKAMLSFSAYTNGVKILSTHQASGSLGAINGIRFLSMGWVILGHTYYFAVGYDDNLLTHFVDKINHWTFSVVPYATVAVDSFFTISGILVAYLTLRELKKVEGAKKLNWFMFFFHRFWRLTPPYMLIMMVGTVILPHVATGPMWAGEDFPGMGPCRENWWTNLLYINNFVNIYPNTEMCMGWTWYLANDMQFYILSPLILLPLFYNVIAGIVSCVIFLAATVITTGLIHHTYGYSAQNANLVYGPTPDDPYHFQRVYIPSYCRMGPYIIGLFTGYLLYRLQCKCKIPKVLNLLGWLVCVAICCCDVYGLYSYKTDHILTQLQSDVFASLHRTGWGVAISWIVFACATGHGGWINEVLSWKPFIPLGRLTFGAYLIHPLAIFLFLSSRQNPSYFSDFEVVYMFIGNVTLSYGAAFVMSLFFESPMMGLEKVFFNKKKSN